MSWLPRFWRKRPEGNANDEIRNQANFSENETEYRSAKMKKSKIGSLYNGERKKSYLDDSLYI